MTPGGLQGQEVRKKRNHQRGLEGDRKLNHEDDQASMVFSKLPEGNEETIYLYTWLKKFNNYIKFCRISK